MKEFNSAAEAVVNETEAPDGLKFKIDGVECTAHHPQPGQLAILMASTGRRASEADMIAGIINFFASTLDKSSYRYVEDRLLDYEDPFGLEQVQDILEWLVEEWTGRPIKLPSGSTPSPGSTGDVSTEPAPVST